MMNSARSLAGIEFQRAARRARRALALIALVWGAVAGLNPRAASANSAARASVGARTSAHDSTSVATFGLGCFWSGEVTFEGREGVISVTSGYTGGTRRNPSYEDVSTGTTGHFESVDIVFDPRMTSYAKLLDIFWHNVDPTQADGQFCDRGPEYPSAIFYHDEAQHRLAIETRQQIEASGQMKRPIVTRILPASTFYPAEDYHQDFYRRNTAYYHAYRVGCRRDERLMQLWGKLDAYSPAVMKVFDRH